MDAASILTVDVVVQVEFEVDLLPEVSVLQHPSSHFVTAAP
jgi:hypothetical protein